MATTADLAKLAGTAPDLVSQVLAGNEVILTNSNQPVARIVPVVKNGKPPRSLPPLKIRPLSRPRVVTPKITGAEIADEMFSRE
jgi:antitoxin (DNA-binding transcriptional repressor) of toxin-antitoxin stability system